MSARPLVFEGPDPEKLLIDAWSVHGTGVRISEPACVRKGGLFGFFQKLHYRIEVLPASEPREDKAQASPRIGAAPVTTTRSALEELVDATEDVLEIGPTSRRSFDEVLDGVASALGDDPSSFAATGLADFTPGTSLATEVAPRVDDAPAEARDGRAGGSGEPWRPHRGATGDEDHLEAVRRLASAAPLGDPAELRGARHGGARTASDGACRRADDRAPGSGREALLALGFEEELVLATSSSLGALEAIEAACSRLSVARPLPDVPGALVAVVGDLGRALEAAGSIVEELHAGDVELAIASRTPPRFTVAGDLFVAEPRAAAALSPGWRRDAVAVVAVATDGTDDSTRWCRAMLRALRPSATLAVVSAAAKPEDVAHLDACVGGVDALALYDLDATVTPAAVARAAIPVARLDGAPATPSRWFELLLEALDRRSAAGR